MSDLFSAFLLEGFRDPRAIFISTRADALGSGTIDDPYSGATTLGPGFGVTLNKDASAADGRTVNVGASHNLMTDDVVNIPASAGAYAGQFPVFNVNVTAQSFQYRVAVPFASTPPPPPNISATAAKVIYRLDEVLRNIGEGVRIHIGPGTFETRGFAFRPDLQAAVQGWAIRARQHITGAGIGATALKLMHATHPSYLTVAIGHDPYAPPHIDDADYFSASDFTVDCNLRSQLYDRVTKGAINTKGSFVRIRRVRAIDFGTQSEGVECFVITTAGGDPNRNERVDCRIEDCIVEQPALNSLFTMTCLLLNSGEETGAGERMGFFRACALRHNYVNCEYRDQPVAVQSITMSGGVATVTTHTAHGRQTDDWVVISGAVVNGATANPLNGSFKITRLDATRFTYQPNSAPAADPTRDIWVGRFSSHWVPLQKIEKVSDNPPIAKLTCHSPHNRKPDQMVNVQIFGLDPIPDSFKPYFGRFPIVHDSTYGFTPDELHYRMDTVPSDPNVIDTPSEPRSMFAGATFQALSGDGGSEAVVEGNRVFNCRNGGPYHDTWGTKDLVARDNYYSGVSTGIFQLMRRTNNLKAGSLSLANGIATFTAAYPHGLAIGQAVRITIGIGEELLGYFALLSVPTATSFTFAYAGQLLGSDYKFATLWQVGLAVVENNVIDLTQAGHPNGFGRGSGIPFYADVLGSQYVFRQVVFRDNIIREYLDPPNPLAYAIELQTAERAVIEGNVVELSNPNPISLYNTKSVHLFDNKSPAGAVYQDILGRADDELSRKIEDALVFSLL